ncbi:hypothetical protein E4U16_005120 [Claviceps sp. LM84 group G4]|nr:hypothetical protein E4U16_005120 [Claviceps sp. LM84 group G4]
MQGSLVTISVSSLYTLPNSGAHLMTPFAGEGVNLAMWDSLVLADIIVKLVKSRNTNARDLSTLNYPEAQTLTDYIQRLEHSGKLEDIAG